MELKSYLSPKTTVKESTIHGAGLFAIGPFKKDEIVGIKNGNIIDTKMVKEFGGFPEALAYSLMQIADDFYIGSLNEEEMTTTGMHVNHPCNPNMGILGNVINVAMRDVGAGEELTADYAMVYSHPSFRLECHCGAENCRKIITGDDWKKKELQEKYRGFFSAYIQKKINKANEVKIEV